MRQNLHNNSSKNQKKIVSERDFDILFGNVEKLFDYDSKLQKTLQTKFQTQQSDTALGTKRK